MSSNIHTYDTGKMQMQEKVNSTKPQKNPPFAFFADDRIRGISYNFYIKSYIYIPTCYVLFFRKIVHDNKSLCALLNNNYTLAQPIDFQEGRYPV